MPVAVVEAYFLKIARYSVAMIAKYGQRLLDRLQ